ncbi:hypothetical protein FPOAC2_12942 [Fusarium poae]|uniref:Uncharacterized protein n=1 Tax=Fusarium poae TaxID=36050 RepID=A0A1B8AHF2_FUSPO|nr:hypothetical protein FPOA_11710 [Fusarium poae]
MPSNHTAIIDYWGFKCENDAKFYICENTWAEFFGCCTTDPCADGSGVCPPFSVRSLSYDRKRREEVPPQDCLAVSIDGYFHICGSKDSEPSFMGCCNMNACAFRSGCSSLGISGLSWNRENRLALLYPPSLNLTEPSSSRITLEPISTTPPSPFSTSSYDKTSSRNAALIRPGAMVGISVAVLFAAIVALGFITKHCTGSQTRTKFNKPTYFQVISQEVDNNSKSPKTVGTQVVNGCDNTDIASICEPRTLTQPKGIAFVGWTWDIVLTLIPICFIARAIAVVDLDGQPMSSYGHNIFELTRLGPSLYPILFAAIASRFYKNFARWRLEQPGGVSLGVLEQVFGSQSFAMAVERVFVVHTHVFLSILILFT